MTKAEATKRAKALQKKLGTGWAPRVWKTTTWYYSCTKYNVSCYDVDCLLNASGRYWCLVSGDADKASGGLAVWSPEHKTFSDPRDAVRHAVMVVNQTMALLISAQYAAQRVVDDFE